MTFDQNLTLFESSKHILAEIKNTNIALRQVVIYQQQTTEQLRYINELLDGFTNGGASLNGYIPDAFVPVSYTHLTLPTILRV